MSDAQAAKADQMRTYLGFSVIVIALVIVAIVFLASVGKLTASTDVATAIGSVTTVTGTLVGFFFGNSAGSAGKEQAQTARDNAEKMLRSAAVNSGNPARLRKILES